MQIWRCDDGLQAKPFFFAATQLRIGRGTRGRNSRCRRNHSPVCLRRHPSGDTGGPLVESLHRKKRAPHLRERLSAVRTRLEPVTSHGQRDCFTLPPSACADTPRGIRGRSPSLCTAKKEPLTCVRGSLRCGRDSNSRPPA